MSREEYQRRLERLRANVVEMSDLVCARLRTALEARERNDDELAREVIEGDDEINELYLDLEGDCIELFALQQPVAGDLRFIAASFKIITDLERIGDLATNVAGYAGSAGGTSHDRYPQIDVQHIGERTVEMVEAAVRAYADDDANATYDVAAADEEIDTLCERASEAIVRDLLETGTGAGTELGTTSGTAADADDDGSAYAYTDDTDIDTAETRTDITPDEILLEDVERLLLTIRDLERVGDHAVNIAARTLYMVENDDELIF
ncbi:phosphate transport system regulatory protein PhoU [Halobiforma lacisalsi AJ5]|uniref:Phosphate transport system regulatory protein PhoU n=1 Tax=Natronobacterium lacisalsi AJ5 TaxID=358396 RepID=M0LHX2_NATLA|nr:phosphate signaling complex protein PhoU [Halobiforma lacisalsi]APW99473.1 phosphate transport system regulatory protein PhoU [Halobiforma lacisalsi AJ5]EMA31590.1 phosphate uptake regulator PhoU [Halobiforma lacisalsi AJ5]